MTALLPPGVFSPEPATTNHEEIVAKSRRREALMYVLSMIDDPNLTDAERLPTIKKWVNYQLRFVGGVTAAQKTALTPHIPREIEVSV